MTELHLEREFLPALAAPQAHLVLLHGWGSNREIWRCLVSSVRNWADVTLIDLPGCGASEPVATGPDIADVDTWVAAILRQAPPEAVYLGWSLGGQLATCVAQRAPRRVSALVTLCSNPCFVACPDWPGMAGGHFEQFRAGAQADVGTALRRFDSLQVMHAEEGRRQRRTLASARGPLNPGALLAGLDLLENLDTREALVALPQPQLHLLSAADELLPAGLTQALSDLLAARPAGVEALTGAGHVAPLSGPAEVATRLQAFLAEQSLLTVAEPEPDELAKAEVAASFSRAAQHYDSAAQLQRDVGCALLEALDSRPRLPEVVLDLGCGTGYFTAPLRRRFPSAVYLGADLAPGMVEYARQRADGPGAGWLVGDAENLPLAAGSVDLVFSSLAIQWCEQPRRLFAELARVLRPGGRCVFTSLGPATLDELRQSWAAVDSHQHVNSFLPPAALLSSAQLVPGVTLVLEGRDFRMEYDRVRELLDELKTLGAHNMTRGRTAGLTGRRALQGMLAAYERWRCNGKLPATYEVLFGQLEKA